MSHINNLPSFSSLANFHNPNFRNNHLSDSVISRADNTTDSTSISEKSVVALKMVQQSISAKFSSTHEFQTNRLNESTSIEQEQQNFFDFEAVAKNVMTFVNSSLTAAKSRGATSNELAEMLGQARQGANSGIDEAIEELSQLNVLDEDLSGGIEKARSLINTALDKAEEDLLGGNNIESTHVSPLTAQSVNYSSEKYSSQANSSDLSITTADGDLVSISFSALEETYASESFNYGSDHDSSEMSYESNKYSSSAMNFSFSVQGDLDEEELQAIQSLIKDISRIEKDFFAGNLDDAFNKAVALGYDEAQLRSFNLELRQTQTSVVSQTYKEIASYDDLSNDKLNTIARPVLDFIGDFKELRENANQMLDREGMQFNQLLESVLNSEFNYDKQLLSQFNNFVEKLT